MLRHLHFTKFLLLSLACHALVIAVVIMMVKPVTTLPSITPVKVVELPREAIKQLPPVEQPVLRRIVPEQPAPRRIVPEQPVSRRVVPERPLPPEAVPMPKKFGSDDEVRLPKTTARTGQPGGADQGKESGTAMAPIAPGATGAPHAGAGPLPFVSQKDIEELARKGMPGKNNPGDDSVTLDTDEFKFISYNRWLKIKVESVLRYPELAAMSGYQGTLYIKFDIMQDGSLGNLELLKSSGYKILDDEALRAIRACAPFQPLPADWHMERYGIRAAVLFYLNAAYIR